jgi:putative transposase
VTEEKVEIVKENAEMYGLNTTLGAIGLPKSTWYYWKNQKVDYEKKYAHLREPVIEILRENTGRFRYRRVLPDLKDVGYPAGERVTRRILKMWDLSLQRWAGKPKPSVPRQMLAKGSEGMNLVARMGERAPPEVFYTDFTTLWYDEGRKKAYLMPVLDDATKWVVGWADGQRPSTRLALEALSMSATTLDDAGLSLEGQIIHHDQDTVYTGYRWLHAVLIKHRGRISFSENGAKGNTTMESFNSRFKGENASLFYEAANIWELKRLVAQQMQYHNCRRRHSACLRANTHRQALGYTAPMNYIIREKILPQSAIALAAPRT